MNPFFQALGDAGYIMDTPGAYLRGALSGNIGSRASGQDMLQSWGVDAGPMGGMAAEMVADPFMLAGLAGGAYKGFKGIQGLTHGAEALSHTDDMNPLLKGMAGFVGDESGAMRPFQEIGQRTDPDIVNARDWFHGSRVEDLVPEVLDPMRSHPNGMLGRGIYLAGDPEYAKNFADPALYKAETNLSGIADVDLPTTPEITGGMRDLLAARAFPDDIKSIDRNFRYYDDLPLWDYLQSYFHRQRQGQSATPGTDDLMQLLRGQGVDALMQTEGKGASMRAMQQYVDPSDILNQSMAVLDPSKITRFDPFGG